MGEEKGYSNLQGKRFSFANMSREKHLEVSRKGAERTHEIVRERRTAQKCLQDILQMEVSEDVLQMAEIPEELKERLKGHTKDFKMYDLLQLVAVGLATTGNMRAMEYCRDTAGDQPVKQIDVNENVITDSDRALMQKISERLAKPDIMIVADAVVEEDKSEGDNDGKNDDENRS